MTLKNRLLFAIVTLVSLCVLFLASSASFVAVSQSNQALEEAARHSLRQQNTQTKKAVVSYIEFIEAQMRNFASSSLILNASKAFTTSYASYAQQRASLTAAEASQLTNYYTSAFAETYRERNINRLSDPASLVNNLPDTARKLQFDFIANSSYPLGEKDELLNLNNGTDYASVHEQYHQEIRQFLLDFGYYDIFIAEPETGEIVYSVFKELDYATSLLSGPYARTGIGEAFTLAKAITDSQMVVVSKIAQYLPSYNAMAGFLATPVFSENGDKVAILIFQIPIDRINGVLTHHREWVSSGFGESGETYLVSPDNLLVTESRFFLEDKKGYLAAINDISPSISKQIKGADTSIGLQEVRSLSSVDALTGKEGFRIVEDYRGVEVFSSFSPVKIGEYTYALLAEVDVEEALGPASDLQSTLLISTLIQALFVIAVAIFIALWLANTMVRPLKRLGLACTALASGQGDLTVRLETVSIPEINNVIYPFNQFIGQIHQIVKTIKIDASKLAEASDSLSAIMLQSRSKANEQLDETQVVASSVEELSMSIADVSRSTTHSLSQTESASSSLKENMERAELAAGNIKLLVSLLGESTQVISSLQHEVGQINSLLSDITSIADQTNLLALNAAIEAARAGEAGRGFSVVADEVRALANRSQKSTVEIGQIVEKMNVSSHRSVQEMDKASTAADGGIHLVDLVTTAMNELSNIIEQVQLMADSVASATEEQDATSNSVSENINRIAEMTEALSRGTEEASEATNELARMAKETKQLVAAFTV
ncbi:methyl-accepting chemotaxis protein [Aestuariibacter sp. A3R04]|uniref:methyl-accepting chemotaxis protein n=1 Tax=Aestuariibacter sp. A3R04 TaxID=2841571 RepID=UPI001C086B23|nr:methyl-accepting chemotaxis protein [Aestuariibacter sp. A3R04]MBU3022494.1 methyl-accepting chemotaxis protein [Aestuariibacter sp. A3R04]